jgi:glyoxylase-like metal-dependent hydrolase (beta-lactamase superfamily II)
MRTILACITLLGLMTSAAAQNRPPAPAQAPAASPRYEVYAIRYAELPGFSAADLVEGAERARKLDIAMVFWLVRSADRAVLVDTGFYRDRLMRQWKPANYIKPSDAVAKLGLKPEDITDIILTHMHWDHADGMDLFPNARVWVQKDEYAYYTGEAWQTRAHGGIEPDDVLAAVKLNLAGRLRFVNGDAQQVLPGIVCYTGGKHTWQSQYVSVATEQGTVVLASDNVYLYENLDTHKPIAQTLDRESNLRAQERMRALASSPRLIVPGHDPAIFTRFPKPGDGVAKIE